MERLSRPTCVRGRRSSPRNSCISGDRKDPRLLPLPPPRPRLRPDLHRQHRGGHGRNARADTLQRGCQFNAAAAVPSERQRCMRLGQEQHHQSGIGMVARWHAAAAQASAGSLRGLRFLLLSLLLCCLTLTLFLQAAIRANTPVACTQHAPCSTHPGAIANCGDTCRVAPAACHAAAAPSSSCGQQLDPAGHASQPAAAAQHHNPAATAQLQACWSTHLLVLQVRIDLSTQQRLAVRQVTPVLCLQLAPQLLLCSKWRGGVWAWFISYVGLKGRRSSTGGHPGRLR